VDGSRDWDEVRAASLLFEDEAILALNKPPGISVMGERHETDLVRMAGEAGERLYPVHRIDKVTSGLVLLAKEVRFHSGLTRQFNKQTVEKGYLVVTRASGPPDGSGPDGLPERGTIELPLSVGRKNRVRVAGRREDITRGADGSPAAARWSLPPGGEFADKRSYPSTTTFVRLWADERNALLAVRPVTGRRHQIRVHLAWIGHPIEGDPLFDRASADRGVSTRLHSWRLAFDAAWAGDARMRLVAPPPPGFFDPLRERLSGAAAEELLARV
jgi:tRNA pseudouridine32 synthase/23S rRNA pseudouridine746 synthase